MARLSLAAQAAMDGRPPLDEPLRMSLYAALPIPRSWSGKQQRRAAEMERWPSTRPDLANILKITEDALTGIVYRDDSLICAIELRKIYSLTPGLIIRVTPLAERD